MSFFWESKKKCYVPENFNEREVIPQSRPSQQAPSPDFSSEFLCLVTAIAINYLFIVGIILVPRAYNPSGLRQESRGSGSNHFGHAP